MMIVSWSKRVGIMKKGIGAAVLALALLGAPGAKAEEQLNVQRLISLCRGIDVEKGFCLGFVAGVVSIMAQTGSTTDGPKKIMGACLPSFVSNSQFRQVFLNWADKNPQLWQRDAELGVVWAVSQIWPCK
jgi:hypothetical protein